MIRNILIVIAVIAAMIFITKVVNTAADRLNDLKVASIYACGMVSGANGSDSAIFDGCKAYRAAYDSTLKREGSR